MRSFIICTLHGTLLRCGVEDDKVTRTCRLIGEMRNIYTVFNQVTRRDRTLWRPRRKLESNTEIDIKRINCEGVKRFRNGEL
jgi:hypothetical protein